MAYFDYFTTTQDLDQQVPDICTNTSEFCVETYQFLEVHGTVILSFIVGILLKVIVSRFFQPVQPDIFLVNYNGKSLAIFGNLKKYSHKLQKLGGIYNEHLVYGGNKMPGWIYPVQKFTKVSNFIKKV